MERVASLPTVLLIVAGGWFATLPAVAESFGLGIGTAPTATVLAESIVANPACSACSTPSPLPWWTPDFDDPASPAQRTLLELEAEEDAGSRTMRLDLVDGISRGAASLSAPQSSEIEMPARLTGLRLETAFDGSWKLRAEALHSRALVPGSPAAAGGSGSSPGVEGAIGADAAAGTVLDAGLAGTALDLRLEGKVAGLDVEASMAQVGEAYRDPATPGPEPAGRRTRLGVGHSEESWHVKADVALQEPDGTAPSVLSYRLDGGVQLPGDLRSTVVVARRESDDGNASQNARLAVRRRFDSVDVGMLHDRQQALRRGRESTVARTGLDLRWKLDPEWTLESGTALVERDRPGAGAVEIRQLFVAPRWQSAENDLQLRLRVGVDLKDRPGVVDETRELLGQGSLVWKLRDERHRADLALDWSVRSAERAGESATEHRAGLSVKYAFGPSTR